MFIAIVDILFNRQINFSMRRNAKEIACFPISKYYGSTSIRVRAGGDIHDIVLSEAYYCRGTRFRTKKGYELRSYHGRRSIIHSSDDFRLFDVHRNDSDVLVVHVEGTEESHGAEELVMAALAVSTASPPLDAHHGSLHHFHERLGHLAYDTIEFQAVKSLLTNHERPVCVTCAQGKQTRNKQFQHDSGENAPIDRIGGVICSDIKGPITPRDRRGNRYMINFIDHKSNYCRGFLARTKDQAIKNF
ncbi:Rve-domain-containing hypothetical protein [Phytophthora megakarya]|uniref:Uncharacterized protein n=1 Tax=Phytophthora megakarya TaxID=4795 RepID=A0A225X2A6_9STRA|nr:Rve-domain-containing hypothetical protein [Phytophthora megakarya]